MRRYSQFWSGRDIARELNRPLLMRAIKCKGATLLVSWQQYRFAPPGGYGNSFFVKLASRIYKRAQAIFAELVRIGRRYADRPRRPDDSADRSADRVITQAQILLALLKWPIVHC